MKKSIIFLSLIFLLGCSNIPEENTTIKIGIFEPLSGIYKESGEEILKGVQLAHKERQYVLDKKIELLAYDTKSLEFEAANGVSYLAGHRNVDALIGTYGVDTMDHALPVIEAAGIPTISASSTFSQIQESEWTTNLAMNDIHQATAMAQFAEEILKCKNIAIVVDEELQYGEILSYTFANQVSDEINIHFIPYHSGDTTFRSQVRRMKNLSIDAVYCPGDPISSAYLIQSIRNQMPYISIMGGDRWDNPSFRKKGGENIEGVYFTTNFALDKLNTTKASQFISNYKKMFGTEPNSYSALGYDAYSAMVYAIEQAQSTNPHKIQHYIRDIDGLEGATGPLYIRYPKEELRPVKIMQIKGKKAHWVRTVGVKD